MSEYTQPSTTQSETIPLYRVENPTTQSRPDGVVSHEDLVGQWFTPNLDTAAGYLRKSTQTFGKEGGPVDGARLVVAHVPVSELDGMHVSQHPVASTMDIENDNYIVPRDGATPIAELPLDEALSDLKGKLGNFNNLKEAKVRLAAVASGYLATHAAQR